MPTPVQLARDIILANRYLSLATTDGRTPWVSPLAYVVEPNYSFIYYSAVDSIHSRNIAANPQVAAAIFDSRATSDSADGLQLAGEVAEVPQADLEAVMALYFEKSFPEAEVRIRWLRPIADFIGLAPQRFYRLRPSRMFKLDPNSHKVDRRLEIDLARLRQLPA